jgi:surface protein
MFYSATAFNGNITNWNTSSVTTMQTMFYQASNFNQDLTNWDTSSVTGTGMQYMFYFATNFNGNITNWDTSSITTMQYMFQSATNFNGNISNWNTSSVTIMADMFQDAAAFNQNLTNWDTSSVTNMQEMFYGATNFNGNISNWNTSKVTGMNNMFRDATAFNQNIGTWNVSSVINMPSMLQNIPAFNQNLSAWDTSSVTNMQYMFQDATAFNQNISAWDTSSVTTMQAMFNRASAFDQYIGSWNVSSVTTMSSMFGSVTLSTTNYDNLLIGWESLPNLKSGVAFDGGNSEYCLGNISRSNIIVNYTWAITDGGYASSCETDPPLISYGDGTEVTETIADRDWIYVNVSADDANMKNVNFTLYNESGLVNLTSYNSPTSNLTPYDNSTFSVNWTGLNNGNYTYNVNVTDDLGFTNYTINRTIDLGTDAENCVTIVAPGIYNLTNSSITNYGGTCITILSSNVIFDCLNNTIDGVNAGDGINVSGGSGSELTNVTIESCRINDFEDGIIFDYVNSSLIQNSTVNSADDNGIELSNSNSNRIFNITLGNQSGSGDAGILFLDADSNNLTEAVIDSNNRGIWITTNANNNTITNTNVTNSTVYGLVINDTNSDDNVFYDNLFNNTVNTNMTVGADNYFNITLRAGTNIMGGNWIGGNYWANASSGSGYSQTCVDNNGNGICDTPMNATNQSAAPGQSGYGIDELPLALTQNTALDAYDIEDDSEDNYGWFSAEEETLPGEMEYFFANFTLDTDASAVTNANCTLNLSGSREYRSYNNMSLWMHFNNDTEGENNTYAVDFSGEGNNGTFIVAADSDSGYTTSGMFSGGFMFDGTGDGIDLPNLNVSGAQARTVSMWIYPTSSAGRQGLFSSGNWAAYQMFSVLFDLTANNNIYVTAYDSDIYTGAETVTLNQWNHIVVTFSGDDALNTNTGSIFINGVNQSITAVGAAASNLNTQNINYAIGYNKPESDDYFTGKIDEVAVFNRSLSADDILELYNTSRYAMTWNNSASLYYYNTTFTYAGNYSWTTTCNKSGFLNRTSSGVVNIRIPLFNQSSLGVTTSLTTVNYNENVNVSVNVSSYGIDPSNVGYNVSGVWAQVTLPDSTITNISLSGSASGGIWSGTYTNTGLLGNHNVTFYANLTNMFNITKLVWANFSVQNTSIGITVQSEANTTNIINVRGLLNRTNSTANWSMNNNIVFIKINNVTLSTLFNNDTNFTGGTATNEINISGSTVKLNLTILGNSTLYSDSFTDTKYTTDALFYVSPGYYDTDDVLFELNSMTSTVGNISYEYNTSTLFYNVTLNVTTLVSPSDPGGNTSLWYSFDNSTWYLFNWTTTSGNDIGGVLTPVRGRSLFYVMLQSDTLGGSVENPVRYYEINHTSYNYSALGQFNSVALNFSLSSLGYSALSWEQNVTGEQSIKLQLRQSANGTVWEAWSANYTSNSSNDISSFSKQFLQYRAWLNTTNGTTTPELIKVKISYINTSTNGTGFYDENVTVPTTTLGVLPLEVSVANSDLGIVGSNTTNITIWANTKIMYDVVKDYTSEYTNYTVFVNFTRNDTNVLIPGVLNVTISNTTGSWSTACSSGGSTCNVSWDVSGNKTYGRYDINITATNMSAYYRNTTADFVGVLEDKNTTGTIYVGNATLTDFTAQVDYYLTWNATINNTGGANMSGIQVYDYVLARSVGIKNISTITPCTEVLFDTICNVTLNITVDGSANVGAANPHFISWRANWTDNDGGVAGGSPGYIAFTTMYVIILANSSMGITNSSVNITIEHETSRNNTFSVNATGSTDVTTVRINFTSSNLTGDATALPGSWISFNTTSITSITAGYSRYIVVNVTVPAQTTQGYYSGWIGVNASNADSRVMNLTVYVPENMTWYMVPTANMTFNTTFQLDTAGIIGNITIYNIGNTNITFNVSYKNSRTTNYNAFGTALFDDNFPAVGLTTNPTTVNVTKGSNANITLYQQGRDSTLYDVGIDLYIFNSSASPQSEYYQDAFTIVELPPQIPNVWFFDNGISANYIAEVNKNLTIKLKATDDINLSLIRTIINITYPGGRTEINATALSGDPTEYELNGAFFISMNYTGNHSPSSAGLYNVTVKAYDSSNGFNTSKIYNFTTYASTNLTISQNISSYTATNVDYTSSETFNVNYTINNTGNVRGLTPSLNFTANSSIIIYNYTFTTNINSGEITSVVIRMNITALTHPGDYNITGTIMWKNPDGATNTSSVVLNLTVQNNRLLSYTPSYLNMTINSSQSNSTDLKINNTGNVELSSIDMSCYNNTVCTGMTVTFNESDLSIGRNRSKDINVTVSVPGSQNPGTFNGTINITEQNILRFIDIVVVVGRSLSWTATPLSLNYTRAAGTSGDLRTIIITNNGNVEIVYTLASSNSSVIQPNVSSITVAAQSNNSFVINYTLPSDEGIFNVTVNITNSSASPAVLNITIMITGTDTTVTVLSPNTTNPTQNVTAGDTLQIRTNASYTEQVITNNSAWNITIGDTSCGNLTAAYDSTSIQWNMSCSAPSVDDGLTYNLTATLIHATYGTVNGSQINAISYDDVSPPVFYNITRRNISLNQNINLSINVTDNINVSTVIANITYPNSTMVKCTMTLNNGLYTCTSLTLVTAGEYVVNYSANDTSGNTNYTTDWFEVYDRYFWNFTFTDHNGAGVSNMTVRLLRPDTSVELASNTTDTNGNMSLFVNKRYYDINISNDNDIIIIKNVNFTNASLFTLNLNKMTGDDLAETIELYKPLSGFSINSSSLSSNSVAVILKYTGLSYDNVNQLTIVKCANWNYVSRACSGTWSVLGVTRSIDAERVTGNATGLSSYFLAENKCGNGLCETAYEETTTTCSADCQEAVAGPAGPGGGGGSSGLTDDDIQRIEDIIKDFLEIGGLKVETTSIYKEMFAGETTTARVKLSNVLNSRITVSISAEGDISNMTFFDTTEIDLEKKEERDIVVKFIAPQFIESGTYDGNLVITSSGKTGKIPVTIRILTPEGKLLDVKIQTLTPVVSPGGTIKLQMDVLNLGKTKTVDVQFVLELTDIETGEILTATEEAFAVETSISEIKELDIPDYVTPGNYMIKATAYYSNIEQSMQASSIAYVTVAYPILDTPIFGIPLWVYLIIGLAIGSGIGGFYYVRFMEARKKRFKMKLDVSKLPRAGPNSAFIGKIAETGIRTFLDMNKLQMHTLIAGATGSGKSVSAQGIIEEALTRKKSVIVFDPTAQWTGFLRKCKDKGMLKRYGYFDMRSGDAKAFDGSIKTIRDPYEMINIKNYINRPGEITIFNISHLTPKEIDVVVASTIEQVFLSEPEESKNLKLLIVYDEVHRLLPKFGGSGKGFIQLERGAREFRKWGIGLVLISQVLSDFVGEVKANIGTEVQMGTRYEGDLERVKMKYGEDITKSIVKAPIGSGMVVNAEYNSGRPYFVSFRPLLHSTKRLSRQQLKKYEKYFEEIEDLEFQIAELKKLKVDTLDLDLEMKLTRNKVKSGQFPVADMYLDSLRPRIEEQWKKLKRKPMHIVKKMISKEAMTTGLAEAKKQRKKYMKAHPEGVISLQKKILDLKVFVDEKKKKGIKTAKIEIKIQDLENRIKAFGGKVNEKDTKSVEKEISALKKELDKL